jgi:hypothetical protein
MNMRDILPQTTRARELYGDFWFNSEPIPVTALRGQVILLMFWDYASASCLRALPYVFEWRRRYEPVGFVTVGVHTPRFPFEKKIEEVQRAIARYGIGFPVVTDNEALIAANYECRTSPELILVDKDGFVRYRNAGEGGYAGFEHALQALLYNAGATGELPMVMDPVRETDRSGVVCYRATPEVFAGYLRGTIGNVEGYTPESVVSYTDPGMYLDGRFYAGGDWMNDRDCIRMAESGTRDGHLIICYQGLSADAVLVPEGPKKVEITVRQDNEFITPDARGADLQIDAGGRSYLVVEEPRLYSVVRNREYGEHALRLSCDAGRFAAYAFSFTTAVIPELISKN